MADKLYYQDFIFGEAYENYRVWLLNGNTRNFYYEGRTFTQIKVYKPSENGLYLEKHDSINNGRTLRPRLLKQIVPSPAFHHLDIVVELNHNSKAWKENMVDDCYRTLYHYIQCTNAENHGLTENERKHAATVGVDLKPPRIESCVIPNDKQLVYFEDIRQVDLPNLSVPVKDDWSNVIYIDELDPVTDADLYALLASLGERNLIVSLRSFESDVNLTDFAWSHKLTTERAFTFTIHGTDPATGKIYDLRKEEPSLPSYSLQIQMHLTNIQNPNEVITVDLPYYLVEDFRNWSPDNTVVNPTFSSTVDELTDYIMTVGCLTNHDDLGILELKQSVEESAARLLLTGDAFNDYMICSILNASNLFDYLKDDHRVVVTKSSSNGRVCIDVQRSSVTP